MQTLIITNLTNYHYNSFCLIKPLFYHLFPKRFMFSRVSKIGHLHKILSSVKPNNKVLKWYFINEIFDNNYAINHPSYIPDKSSLFLPHNFQHKNFLSGLITLSSKERLLITEKSQIALEYQKVISIHLLKVIYNICKVKKKRDETEGFREIFDSLFGFSKYLTASSEVKNILSEKSISLIQHMTVLLLNNFPLSFELFKKLCDNESIDCSSFQGNPIPPITLVEFIHTVKMKNFIGNNHLTYFLINPSGFVQLPVYFCEISSMTRTGQKHADLLIILKNSVTNNGEKYYVDIKTYITMNVYYSRFSLFHQNDKLLLKLMNDFTVSLKHYIDKQRNISDISELLKLFAQLQAIKSDKNIVIISEKYQKFLKKLSIIIFDENFKELKIGFSIDAGLDLDFDVYLNNINPTVLNQVLEEISSQLSSLFPHIPLIEEKSYMQNIYTSVQKILTEEMKKELDNYLNISTLKEITL